ncbi:MAG: hypothetical protein ACXVP0_08780 [Bacteroidia bacterium]
MKDAKQYYKELGKLVYAVAAADGSVQDEETETLHSFVVKELAAYEPRNDSSGMNYAFYTDFEFENTSEKQAGIEECVESYTRFVQDNFERGDEPLLRRSMHLLEQIAKAYLKQKEKLIISLVKRSLNRVSARLSSQT